MRALSPSHLAKVFRLVAVTIACLSTPTVRDVIGGEWLSDVECCADDCDESGMPCSQQCEHCICGHYVTVPVVESGRALVLEMVTLLPSIASSGARSGHLDPPFRPPVS